MNEQLFYDLKRHSGLAPSMATQLARELGRRIVSGSDAPGSLIEDELALAERYQVSRSVVRDAVKILVGKGLLEVRRGIGTRVRARNLWGLLDDDVLAWHLAAPQDANFLRQLMDVRRVFEPKAALWAAERASDDDIAGIRQAIEAMALEVNSVEQFIVADASFHRAVLLAANNEFLAAMEGVIYSALLVSIRLTNNDPRDNTESIAIHRKVCEAIEKRNGKKAERLMLSLLESANNRLNKKVEGL